MVRVSESTGQFWLMATNSYTFGTYLGYSGATFGGIVNFNNTGSFGTGNIVVSNTGVAGICAMVVQTNVAVSITNKWTWSGANSGVNIVGNPAGVTFSGTVAFSAVATNANLYSGATGNLVVMSGIISGGKAEAAFSIKATRPHYA